MAVSKLVLGMNARNYLFIKTHNSRRAKKIADNKILTKEVCYTNDVPTPLLITKFNNLQTARQFDWSTLPSQFVLKPAAGYGGGGIMVIRKWNGNTGKTSENINVTSKDLESHVFDILEGAFSLSNFPDTAFVEALVTPHSTSKKLAGVECQIYE